MGPDPFGTSMKLVRISLVFTWDLVDPVWIGSAVWYQMGPLMKVIPLWSRTFPVWNRHHVNRVDTTPKRIWTYPIPCKHNLHVQMKCFLVLLLNLRKQQKFGRSHLSSLTRTV